jgi:hypothetical protein
MSFLPAISPYFKIGKNTNQNPNPGSGRNKRVPTVWVILSCQIDLCLEQITISTMELSIFIIEKY